ncbi:fatty acid desaturase family protein [Streptomyces sp. enrichment culture]|uniref:fatty acid desaturase family protein n=1 Tax=Streptomyces sp. enrichment culture TaxID=1795815 RepID=UPI003F55EF09
MSETVADAPVSPQLIFERARTSQRDQAVFIGKLGIVLALGAAGVALVLAGHPLALVAGIFLLGALYTHMVELQHQCLHHSAFVKGPPHRTVGVLLGLPLLVSYSHYRVRHLQHHRYLGTDQDTEFFGFDTRQPLTLGVMLRYMFDYPRLVTVARDGYRAWRGTWEYDAGRISERMKADTVAEYRLMGAAAVAAAALCVAGHGEYVLTLWLLPMLLVATPLHFLVELPEHIRCDNDTTDVLRNTRSISGSWFSTWYTNGNNLHVEHHAAMTVPINRLPERHEEVLRFAKHTDRSYWTFYRGVLREVMTGPRRRAAAARTDAP